MKQTKLFKGLLVAILLLCSLYANAYSFSATNSDGVLIYYSITTSDEYEYAVSVSYNSNRYYRGPIKIPETARNNSTGRKYTVIGISTDALYWGGGVTTIELSSTISYINGRIGSSNLRCITVDEENPYFCDVDGVLFTKDMKTLFRFPPASSLFSCTLPDSVTEIRDGAFDDCPNFTEVTSLNPEPPTCTADAFWSVNTSTCILYVPKGSKDAYSTATGWENFDNIVEIEVPEGIESVSSDDAEVVGYYTIEGRAVETPQRGINIVKYSDGGTKKVMMK